MSRYIDADALIKEIEQDIDDGGLTERYVFYRINEAPSIDIVRCEECIHRHEHEWYNTCDKHIGHGFEDDYFCKDGERNSKNNSNQI